jgi:hypothetical protein
MNVKLSDALKNSNARSTQDLGCYFTEGSLAPDPSEGYVRIYPNPLNHRKYLIVNQNDIVGDLYKFTDEELLQANMLGHDRYRVAIKHGSIMHRITVETLTAGSSRATSQPRDTLCVEDACTFEVDCRSPCTRCNADFKCDHD